MKALKLIIYSLVAALIISACGKEGGCFSGTGSQVNETRTLSPFDSIVANDAFEIYLQQDSSYSIDIFAGEKLIPSVGATVENRTLVLTNSNRCEWTKPRSNKIKLTIKAPQFRKVKLTNTCILRSIDTLKGDELGLVLMDKVQDVDLTLKVKTFYYWNNPPCGGKVVLRGESEELKIWNWALICIDARNVACKNALVYSNSIGDIYVSPSKNLDCTILHRGNVYYYGNPLSINLRDEGEGQLIKLDL